MSSNTPHPRTIALERQVTVEIRAGNFAGAIEILRLAQHRDRTP
jgi:Flp pilus assembly protein TadD